VGGNTAGGNTTGGNQQAVKLSGAQKARIRLAVYVVSGVLAGLGGLIEASYLKSGNPKAGDMAELSVIAAVILGGTSLSGGEGRMLGTLLGVSIVAVLENGMTLTRVESYTQHLIVSLIIFGAIALDVVKKRGWRSVWAAA
jgi:ribose transport system permease protein